MSRAGNPGLILAFGAAIAYGLINVGLRWSLDNYALTVWGLLLMRGVVALPMTSILVWKQKLDVKSSRPLLMGTALCSLAATICLTISISLIPLYQALVLLYLSPALTIPLACLINGDSVRRADLTWVASSFFGAVIMLWPDESAGLFLGLGHLAGAGAAISYAGSFVLANRLGPNSSGLEPMFYFGLWAIIFCSFICLVIGEPSGLTNTTIWPALGLGFIGVAGLLMVYTALRWIKPYKVGVIGMLEIVLGLIASYLIFDDPITLRALLGSALIIGAAIKLRRE